MTWIKTAKTSFTGQSSVSIDNCFSDQYTHYIVVRDGNGSAANILMRTRLRVAGIDDTSANYRSQDIGAGGTTLYGGRLTGQTSILNAMGYTEASSMAFNILRISNPFQKTRTTAWNDFNYDTDGNIEIYRNVYSHDLLNSYDGLTIFTSSGTITGSITVYGLRES